MTTVAEPTKKKAAKKASAAGCDAWERLDAVPAAIVDGEIVVVDGEIVAHEPETVAASSKPKVKPGHKDFDWKTEYPDDDDVYVFTSSEGLTIGLTALGPKRKPKPGLLRRLHREGGMSVMWYFIELASSDASLKLQEELDEEEYSDMLRGWAEFAGIELSE